MTLTLCLQYRPKQFQQRSSMPLLQPPSSGLRTSDLTYTDAYTSILRRVRRSPNSSAGGIVVFVGTDLDGLLASKILACLFRQDDVPYRLIPVGGYEELDRRKTEVAESGELHTLILLSLGSLLPLSSFFPVPPTCHLHIIDAHRPWNLQNLFGVDFDHSEVIVGPDDEPLAGPGKIWVWGDGDEASMNNVKKSWEALEFEPDSDSDSDSGSDSESKEDDDEDDEDEDEDDDDEGTEGGTDVDEVDEDGNPVPASKVKRRRTGSREENANGNGASPRKKKRRNDVDESAEAKPKRMPKAIKNAHYTRLQKYYEAGTHHGMSAAQTIYLLATVLERADNDLLWLAILALTGQYISAKIDRDKYEVHHSLYLDEVARLNPPHLDVENGSGIARIPNPDDRRIAKSEELRFTLFRHWNLYDAMLHSGYVAGRMSIWKEKGRKRLQGLLAKMGFSLQQCKQTYAHMDMDLKKHLRAKLDITAPEYGLVELAYPSFTRSYGFRLATLSAADAVEGLSALLEAATGVRIEVEVEGGQGGGEWFGGGRQWNAGGVGGAVGESERRHEADTDETGEDGEADRKQRQWNVANFWIAYDALEDVTLLKRSLLLAKALHSAIIRQGSALLDKSTIRPLRTFRWASMNEGPDLRLFCHPSSLSRLALWLVDSTRERWQAALEQGKGGGEKGKALPFVVACLNEEKGTYLVVGVTGAPEFGDVRKNRFGLAFQSAAEESGAGAKHDMFDTSVVEVKKEDMLGFIEALHLRST